MCELEFEKQQSVAPNNRMLSVQMDERGYLEQHRYMLSSLFTRNFTETMYYIYIKHGNFYLEDEDHFWNSSLAFSIVSSLCGKRKYFTDDFHFLKLT